MYYKCTARMGQGPGYRGHEIKQGGYAIGEVSKIIKLFSKI
jgi:hypothetical protein